MLANFFGPIPLTRKSSSIFLYGPNLSLSSKILSANAGPIPGKRLISYLLAMFISIFFCFDDFGYFPGGC